MENLLNGKTKELFDRWLTLNHKLVSDYPHGSFFNLPETCQNALIIEWLDSTGIYISSEAEFDKMLGYNRGFVIHIFYDKGTHEYLLKDNDVFETRQEATKSAIETAVKILNEK